MPTKINIIAATILRGTIGYESLCGTAHLNSETGRAKGDKTVRYFFILDL